MAICVHYMASTIAGSYYIFISSLDYKAIMKTQDHLNEMTFWCLFIAICSILTFLLITNIGLGATNEEKKHFLKVFNQPWLLMVKAM